MKLTLKIKLLPTEDQSLLIIDTIKEANSACNFISDVAWDNKCFSQFKIHKLVYKDVKSSFRLTSQVIIRCISKVADSYKLDKKNKRTFNLLGSISYDNRILNYKPNNIVSIWAIGGRLKIPFICHNEKYKPFIKGEANLIYRNKKFYIFQAVDIPDKDIIDVEEFIGVDMGIVEIATLSNGKIFNSKEIQKYREKRQKVRSSLQSKCTKNAKRVLKRLSGKETTHCTIINHTISKQIVSIAKSENKGLSIENLNGIRRRSNRKNKKLRTIIGNWSFYQLRNFLEYKCLLNGVKLIVVPPAYTSKTCHNCFHIGNRNGKLFTCKNCNSIFDADINAAKNIALLGMSINHPEKPTKMYCNIIPMLGLKSSEINFSNCG